MAAQSSTSLKFSFRSFKNACVSRLNQIREKMYKAVARQLHGVVPCWVCGEHVWPEAATLEHIKPKSEGGNSHAENLAISHELCNNQRHALGAVPVSVVTSGRVKRKI
jgi:5-methylcytosine-specific restriction endonuclease McrA